ncbi:hypothetical protein [Marinobacter sp.]|uniref:hypothetical protein n=1 Tax=Marinobacter sp. TaxID=50741 RepID=UPI003A8FBED9
MAGLINVGRQYQQQATQGLQRAESMANAREQTGENLKAAEKQQKMSAMGTGAAIGMMVGGPIGMGVGAGIGLLASSIF